MITMGVMIVGIDEVGRGAWAGPMVMAAVAIDDPEKIGLQVFERGGFFHWSNGIARITDSKKLRFDQRLVASELINAHAELIEIVEVPVSDINSQGIRNCWDAGLDTLIDRSQHKYCTWLVDGDWLSVNARNIGVQSLVRGDSKEFAIACASIIAKVYRDELMIKFAESYNVYDWESNKGYGTRRHREAIALHGVCDQHRELWVRKCV